MRGAAALFVCELCQLGIIVAGSLTPFWVVLGWDLTDGEGNGSATKIQMKKLDDALVVYASKHQGVFPARLEDAARYFPDQRVPTDAWGNAFDYTAPAGEATYVIRSYGRYGEPGGEGAEADITDWAGTFDEDE
jgi:hypothetical protein